MPQKINNLVCNKCSTSIGKLNRDADKWYVHGMKVFCPDCVKTQILDVFKQAIRYLPKMKASVVFHLLGADQDRMHLSDASYLKDVENKLHSIKSQKNHK